jgi:signal transduction histidine kinase/ActR/RegA family two-component response regulator
MSVAPRLADPNVFRRCIRELVGFSALPAWAKTSREKIPAGLAEILLTSLAAEFVYVRIRGGTPDEDLDAVRASSHATPLNQLDAIRLSLAPHVLVDGPSSAVIPNPFADGNVQIAIAAIGHGRDAGVVIAGSHRPEFPGETEQLLLEVAANQAALALKRRHDEEELARLLMREQAARREAEAAVSMLQRLETVLEGTLAPRRLTELLVDLLRRTRAALDADTGVILLLDADERSLIAVAAYGFSEDLGPPIPVPVGSGVAGHIAMSDAGLIVEDLSAVELIRASLRSHIRSLVGVPIVVRGRLIGVMHIGSATLRRFTPADLGFLRMVAERAALAIERVRLDESELQQREQLLAREQAARADIERAARLKDEFLAVLSHELRTPLNAVLGYAHLLELRGLTPERADHALHAIQRNAQAQARLIESLLDLSRIMAGKLELELKPLDVSSVVRAAADVVRPAAAVKGITVQVSVPEAAVTIVGDGGRLQQILWNLLSNGVKFTPSGGEVRIHLMQGDGDARIYVSDTGQGISAEFLPHVFDRFAQADRARGAQGGLGLGLALVRELVEAHGGTIAAESPGAGEGSTFVVTLSVVTRATVEGGFRPSSAQPAALADQRMSLPPVKVLIVDDDDDARDWLGFMLESRGAVVQTASSAREAFEMVSQHEPDVLLADIRMPDEDGYTLIQKLRARERGRDGPRLRAIAVTAYASVSDRERAIAVGFDAHVEKPINPAELLMAIAAVTGVQKV